MDQYIGKLLDNRYEILELVGVGGMARVYKARCHRLNRLVAIKILREDLAQDSELRRRFHDESQAVAMLSHPNIVAVYDVSRSSELEYIVMELIDGITLKQYMQKKGNKLNWREALHFITQIIKALGHAHSRGIIHRDIKPHNVMVLRDGSVKVADFGIARVMSGGHSTLTQEALGSVHYISPEQARGSHIDARSDIYSAGVVLYEMITGRLPFEGDNAVSVAIQHINSIPLSPREIDPSIPEALEAITMKAMAPNPDNRYSSADEMLADLEEFRKNPTINFDYNVADFLPEESLDDDKTQIHTVSSSRTHDSHVRSHMDSTRIHHRIYEEEEDEEEEEEDSQRNIPWPIIGAVAGILVFIFAVLFLLYRTVFSNFFGDPTTPTDGVVPDLIGSVYEEIKDDEELLGDFKVVIAETQDDDTAEPGTILDQDPKPNSKVEDGETEITVTISNGPKQIVMIDLSNMDYMDAYLALKDMGLKNYTTDYEYHDSVEKDHVISYTPYKDLPVTPDTEVHLVISKGPKVDSFELPDFTDKTREQVESQAQMMNLRVEYAVPVFSETVPKERVVTQYPIKNTMVEEGSTVRIQLSKGPDPSLEPPKPPEPPQPPKPTEVTKEITIPLPERADGGIVKLTVMLDGVVILEQDFDTAMDISTPPLTITAPAGSTKTVTYYYDGVLNGNIPLEFK